MNNVFTIKHPNGKTYKMFLPWSDFDFLQKMLAKNLKPYEFTMLLDIAGRINKDEVFLDVGANIGNHSIFIACYGIEVLAFEPNNELLPILKKSIHLNHLKNKITVYPLALGAKKTKADFKEVNLQNRGAQSLTLDVGEISVVPYDSLGIDKKVSVIKIDTEGMEYDVLRGMAKTISRFSPPIYFECNNIDDLSSIFDFMNEHDYFYWDTFNSTPTHLFLHKTSITDNESRKKRLIYFTEHLKRSIIPHTRLS